MRRGFLLAAAGLALLSCYAETSPARAELAASAAAVAAPAGAAAANAEAAVRHVRWVRHRIWSRHPETPAQRKESLDALRKSLIEKLQALNGQNAPLPLPLPPPLPDASPVTDLPAAPAPDTVAAAPAPKPPSPPCAPTFAMENWKGPGNFNQGLIEMRQAVAANQGSAASLDRLAEFYLGYGLEGEALDVAQEVLNATAEAPGNGAHPATLQPPGSTANSAPDQAPAGGAPPTAAQAPASMASPLPVSTSPASASPVPTPQQSTAEGATQPPADGRAVLDADLAHLLMGEPVGATSALLTNPAACTRPDMALWQALEATATHEASGFAAIAKASLAPLRKLPEPLLEQAVFRIAAATNDKDVLMGLAAIVRKTKDTNPEDVSARLLLDARVAALKGDTVTERDLLASAARNHGTVPALMAEARLAELDSTRPGADTASETRLADIARVYRDDAIGQSAAAYLAERRLRQGQYAAALAVADQSARFDGAPRLDSRGAAIIARVLRTLLVDLPTRGLPPPTERIALFLRYQGYATPGPKGDDIRLAAAQMLLAHDLPATALDVLHQLVNPIAAAPAAQAALAMAEAKAGEPGSALALVQASPPSDDMKRAAAEALARLGRPADAAQQLAGLNTIPDRLRRAALLGEAKDWNDAAAAYADLLQDAALTGSARQQALERYSFALALAGDQPDAQVAVPANGLAARVIAALPPASLPGAANGPATVAAVRAALSRVQQIETLLPAATANQGS